MPEGDTVHLAAARLDAALGRKLLTRTDFRVPSIATSDLSGRELKEVVARGKHLLFRIEDGVTLHTHFKMEGSWHLYGPGERWRGPAFQVRAVLMTDDRVAVGFRLAVVELLPTNREEDIVGHLGPDVLGPDWDAIEAVRRIEARPDEPLGDVLIDQTVIAGAGNVYRNEICFLRGLHPSTPVRAAGDISEVVGLLKRMMEANRATGRQITTGVDRPGQHHYVYGRRGLPCRRCGAAVAKDPDKSGQNPVTYWCPHCQSSNCS